MNSETIAPSLSDIYNNIAEQPASAVKCTYHFLVRFSERVAPKCRRRWHFAEQAYLHGEDTADLKNCHLRKYCEARELSHGTRAKVYHGFIYWFYDNVAITVTPVPKWAKI